MPTEPWKIPVKKKRTGAHVRTAALNPNSLGMALDCSDDYAVEFKEWNFRKDSNLSAMREFLCTASEHPGKRTSSQQTTLIGFEQWDFR